MRAPRQRLSDIAESDDADSLAGQLEQLIAGFGGVAPGLLRPQRAGQSAGQGEHER